MIGTALPVLFGVVVGERPVPIAWAEWCWRFRGRIPVRVATATRAGGRAAWLGAIAGPPLPCSDPHLRTGSDSGLWPLVAARLASVITLGSGPGMGTSTGGRPGTLLLISVAALLDIAGNVFFLLAVRRELLSLVRGDHVALSGCDPGSARIFFASASVAAVGRSFACRRCSRADRPR